MRRYGRSKALDGGIARQFMLAVVQSDGGIPLDFCVFEGHQGEVKTLVSVLNETFARYRIKQAVVVADRGLLSLENLQCLEQIKLKAAPQDQRGVQYIVALPAARYKQMAAVLAALAYHPSQSTVHETRFNDDRLVVAHDPQRAKRQREAREHKLHTLCACGEARSSRSRSKRARTKSQ